MRTPVFLSRLHVNSTVHSFIQTDVMREAERKPKDGTGPTKLCTCVMPGEKTNLKNVQCCSKHICTSYENIKNKSA